MKDTGPINAANIYNKYNKFHKSTIDFLTPKDLNEIGKHQTKYDMYMNPKIFTPQFLDPLTKEQRFNKERLDKQMKEQTNFWHVKIDV